jgi:hypothetical protein
MADRDGHFFDRLVKKHVSGQLKVAPEHVSNEVLRLMNKPDYAVYERFARRFASATQRAEKQQYLLPYYISSHPGSDLNNAIELALTLKKQGFVPEQVQDFYPTPGTVSTCMFHTGLDPMTGKSVYVAKTPKEKAMQRALLQFDQRRNWPLIREALREAGREDLIGPGGLVPGDNAGGERHRSTAGGRPSGKVGVSRMQAASKAGKRTEESSRRSECTASGEARGRKTGSGGLRQTGRADDSRLGKSARQTTDRPMETELGTKSARTAPAKAAENRTKNTKAGGRPAAYHKSGGKTDSPGRGSGRGRKGAGR